MSSKFKVLSIFLILIFVSCSSDENQDDCVKTISIPQVYVINNQSYYNYSTLEVPCNFDEPTDVVQIEPPILEDFSYSVIYFEYISDTGNNSSRLQYEIQLNNLSNQTVQGVPYITFLADGIQSSSVVSTSSCLTLEAYSSCTIIEDSETSHDLGIISSIEFIDLKYYLTN